MSEKICSVLVNYERNLIQTNNKNIKLLTPIFPIFSRFEMLEEWDKALQIYDSILEEDDANSAARKRKVAIYRQQGEIGRAIGELNKYLKE